MRKPKIAMRVASPDQLPRVKKRRIKEEEVRDLNESSFVGRPSTNRDVRPEGEAGDRNMSGVLEQKAVGLKPLRETNETHLTSS
jgi:hypothetical protein